MILCILLSIRSTLLQPSLFLPFSFSFFASTDGLLFLNLLRVRKTIRLKTWRKPATLIAPISRENHTIQAKKEEEARLLQKTSQKLHSS